MKVTRLLVASCSTAALATAIWATPAAAQQQAAPAQPRAEPRVSEIIVTARKRQESILNVPVVETAIPAEQLQRFQTKDLRDVATLVPGLAFGESVLSIGTQVSLRGVGTTAYDPGIDQSVSLNIDGLPLSQGLAYSSGFFDAGMIEVLKGPQALFYGKSSPGGVIAIRTADPTNEVEVRAQAGYEFEARERRAELIVSGPLTETLKARLAGSYSNQDGFYKNIVSGPLPPLGGQVASKRVPALESWMVRGTVLWNPTEQFDARLKVNTVKDTTTNAAVLNLTNCPDGLAGPGGLPFLNPADECKKNGKVSTVDMDPAAYVGLIENGRGFVESTQTYGTLEMNIQATDELTLTSQTGYYLLHSRSQFNAAQASFAGPGVAVINGFRRRQWTQEFRLNSDYEGPLNFTLGAFAERGRFSDLVTLLGNTRLMFPALLQKGVQTVHIDTNSVFGQLRYKITPELELAAGARWTDETRTNEPVDYTTGVAIPVPKPVPGSGGPGLTTRPKLNANNWSPEITLTYRPTDDLTYFAAAKRGYKSGSFNVATPPVPFVDNSFGDEKVTGGELGMKSRLLDRALLFNLAGYYYEYKGLQVGSIVPVENNIPVTTTINAGSARIYGIEAEAVYRVPQVENLTLNLAVNWNDTKFTELDNVPCYGGQTIAAGCDRVFSPSVNGGIGGFTAQDLSGLPLVRAATWQANFGFDWETDVGSDMTLILSNNNHYSSKYLVNLGLPWYQKGFIKSDLSLTLQGAAQKWEVALIGKNLTNVLTSGNCTNFNGQGGLLPGSEITGTNLRGPSGIDEIGCWMDRGRELWVRVTYRPFAK
ncbi:TonB-dependent receptor [Phenylobacterium sp. LjRoot219]|uniref:TonB-dependent receptor n=1 Tax=Phenylobacterium sp. LjRoot219 TaxID=3342283 RepID=UPI003ECDCC0E